MSKPLVGADILQLDEMDVAPEDVVFHKFYMNKMNSSKKPKKKKKKTEDEAAEDLIGDNDEDDESDNEEIDAILDSTNTALDAEGEYDYDDLDQIADEDDNDLVGNDSDEGMEFPADMGGDDEMAGDDASDDDVSIGDAEDGDDDEEDIFEVNPRKRKSRGKSGASPFASLEEYEHLLDDNEDEKVKDSKKPKKSKRESKRGKSSSKKSKSKKKKVST